MQPNEQQSDLGQPAPGVVPPQPFVPAEPAQSVQPFVPPVQPAVPVAPAPAPTPFNPAALQQAIAEVPAAPASAPVQAEEAEDGAGFDEDNVTWTAHEAIHHEKGASWFAIFTVLMIALLGLSIWTQAWSFAVLIVVITVVVFIYSKRPPRELTYTLTGDGLTVDGRLHEYDEFKSFGVIEDGEALSVMLIPTQRFQPGLTVYFPEESGEDIVDVLSSHLPMKELHLDMFDRMARLLRL